MHKIASKLRTNGSFWRRFGTSEAGNMITAFGLAMPLVVATVGVAVDYQRASSLKSTLQSAADEALITATTAAGNGAPVDVALAIANAHWQANVPQIAGNSVAPKFQMSKDSGQVTASVSYTGEVPTTFARILGINSVAVSGLSGTAAAVTSSTPVKYSGTGSSWGDPHLEGADGSSMEFLCPNPYWYNLLSDGGVEVNVACYHQEVGKFAGADVITDETLVLGSHVISIHQGPPNPDWKWPTSRMWLGSVTIDGVEYNPSSTATLATWPQGSVTAVIGDGGDNANQSLDNITITTPQYTIQLGFAYNNGGQVSLTAANAGTCGAPGGMWGETLNHINLTKVSADGFRMDASDFALDTATSTAPEFNRRPCTEIDVASAVRLTR